MHVITATIKQFSKTPMGTDEDHKYRQASQISSILISTSYESHVFLFSKRSHGDVQNHRLLAGSDSELCTQPKNSHPPRFLQNVLKEDFRPLNMNGRPMALCVDVRDIKSASKLAQLCGEAFNSEDRVIKLTIWDLNESLAGHSPK